MEKTKIAEFIKEHHVLTTATCIDNVPYCASVFYALLEDVFLLVFISDKNTRHITEALQNQTVAGTIVLETETVGLIRGLQFCGKMTELSGKLKLRAKTAYIKRFPYAILSGSPLWAIEINYAKLTDNRLGFGKKIVWEPSSVNHVD